MTGLRITTLKGSDAIIGVGPRPGGHNAPGNARSTALSPTMPATMRPAGSETRQVAAQFLLVVLATGACGVGHKERGSCRSSS